MDRDVLVEQLLNRGRVGHLMGIEVPSGRTVSHRNAEGYFVVLEPGRLLLVGYFIHR